MRISLINPREFDVPDHPLGILYLAAVLEAAGHPVHVLDTDCGMPAHRAAELALGHGPRLVGITASTPQLPLALAIARQARALDPDLVIVLGGAHPTVCPEEVLASPFVDHVVVGEGERVMLALVNALERNEQIAGLQGVGTKVGGAPVLGERAPLVEDLDELPFPARHLLDNEFYFAAPRIRGTWTRCTGNVLTSRGCPFPCIWCSSHTLFGHTVRYRSPANVVDEIRHLRSKYGIDSVYFVDDTLTLDHGFIHELCDRLIARRWAGLRWACQSRVSTLDEALLAKMKRAGCAQLDFGVESGSPRILKLLRKGITVEQIRAAFALCRKHRIKSFGTFMVGVPGETWEDITATARLLDEIRPDMFDVLFATPYPGTVLYDMAMQQGLIHPGQDYTGWYSSKQSDRPSVIFNGDGEETVRYRSYLHNRGLVRNYWTIIKDPMALLGSVSIVAQGVAGFPRGFRRYLATGKLDSILVEVIHSYRHRTKVRARKASVE